MVMADLLTQAGHQVKISASMSSENDGETIQAWICLKAFTDPLNISTLASTSALAGFFRTVGFSWLTAHYGRETVPGLGLARHISVEQIPHEDRTIPLLATSHLTSRDGARQWIIDSLESLAAL